MNYIFFSDGFGSGFKVKLDYIFFGLKPTSLLSKLKKRL